MIVEEWKKKIRRDHIGFCEETITYNGDTIIVWFYVETGGRDENFPDFIQHAVMRYEDGTEPVLMQSEWDEVLDIAFKQRVSASEHG